MATFYYNQSKSNVYRHGEPIDVIHNRKADVISQYNSFFFSNSFIYKSGFSLNLLKDHVLNQHSKEQQLVLFRDDTSSSLTIPNKNSKKYVYMTVVWGNSFVHGVLALATSLKFSNKIARDSSRFSRNCKQVCSSKENAKEVIVAVFWRCLYI